MRGSMFKVGLWGVCHSRENENPSFSGSWGGSIRVETVAFTWVDTKGQKSVVIGSSRIVKYLYRSDKL